MPQKVSTTNPYVVRTAVRPRKHVCKREMVAGAEAGVEEEEAVGEAIYPVTIVEVLVI